MGCGGRLERLRFVLALCSGAPWRANVFCHPFEGALLLLPADGTDAVALDRLKNETYLIPASGVIRHSEDLVEVPSSVTPLQTGGKPQFGLDSAIAEIGGKRYEIRWAN